MQTLSLAPIKKSYNFQILNIIVASKPNTASLNGSKGQVLTKDKDYHSIKGQPYWSQIPYLSKIPLNRFFKKLIFTLDYSLFNAVVFIALGSDFIHSGKSILGHCEASEFASSMQRHSKKKMDFFSN